MDRPIPGLERAGEIRPATDADYAALLGNARAEWSFHAGREGSYTLTYLTDAGVQLAEADWRWAAGDIDFDQNNGSFTVSIRCDQWDYNEAADSRVIAEKVSGLEDAIQLLTARLRDDNITG